MQYVNDKPKRGIIQEGNYEEGFYYQQYEYVGSEEFWNQIYPLLIDLARIDIIIYHTINLAIGQHLRQDIKNHKNNFIDMTYETLFEQIHFNNDEPEKMMEWRKVDNILQSPDPYNQYPPDDIRHLFNGHVLFITPYIF